jgi:RimJ/RimL family protein N-acetyltransferase
MAGSEQEGTAGVRLRDITLDDADMLDAWSADERDKGGFNDFGAEPNFMDRDALAKGPYRNERNGMLIIERVADGAPIGTVGWHRVSYGPNPESGVWNFGIDLIPEARGQGHGSEAQRLLAEWLFEHTEANRVEASTDLENIAEQRALEKAGYTREGIARGAQFRAGRHRDLVTYARLRTDPD